MNVDDRKTAVDWWGGRHDTTTTFFLKCHDNAGGGGVYRIALDPNYQLIVAGWASTMRETGPLQLDFERLVLRLLMGGAGMYRGGWAEAVAAASAEGIEIERDFKSQFALSEHRLSAPVPLREDEFAAAKAQPGRVALQRPREEWRGLMAIPTSDSPLFVPAHGSTTGTGEPSQLGAAVWSLHRRKRTTPAALFEVAAGGSSPLQLIDLLAYDGVDLRSEPWSTRRSLLLEALAELDGAGADLSHLQPIVALESREARAVEDWQLWLTSSDASYGSMLHCAA